MRPGDVQVTVTISRETLGMAEDVAAAIERARLPGGSVDAVLRSAIEHGIIHAVTTLGRLGVPRKQCPVCGGSGVDAGAIPCEVVGGRLCRRCCGEGSVTC